MMFGTCGAGAYDVKYDMSALSIALHCLAWVGTARITLIFKLRVLRRKSCHNDQSQVQVPASLEEGMLMMVHIHESCNYCGPLA